MADSADPHSLSRPTIYLALMAVFVALAGFLVLILYRPIATAFAANPGLNGLIIGVLILGIILSVFQVMRLMPEIKWVNGFRLVDHGAGGFDQPNPRLLSQLASYLRDSQGASGPTMSTQTVRSILESVGTRLDEGREILRYMIGLLVFLGLLGTFWGLTQTIASVGDTIDGLDVTSGDFGTIFENLKTGLSAPLDGMGTAFSSSLFGLAGSLVLGFLDLQAGQAQNRFYTELEDWMSNMAGVDVSTAGAPDSSENAIAALERSVDRLARQIAAQNQLSSSQTASAAGSTGNQAEVKQSIDSLAAGVQSLVQHMRSEQQMLRDWVEDQGEHTKRLATVMEDVSRSMASSAANGGRGQEPGE
ncbi:MAG: MotA/TolQ/ExbB proton channel family protein [Hyphomicrobiales bacterium]